MPLTDENVAFLQSLAEAGAKPFFTMEPPECREAFETLLGALPKPELRLASMGTLQIQADHGWIPIRTYRPKGPGPFPVLVFMHGGGWVIGTLDGYDTLCAELSAGTDALVVSVDYRLAPEAPFPAAPDDCLTALKWVAANAVAIDGDPTRIAVAGDSAGGNLAAVTALRAREEGVELCGQLLIYPATKLTGSPTASTIENADGPLLTLADMEYFIGHYLATPEDGENPNASPLLAGDLSGLPPALIQTAEFDPLRDEGEDYGRAMRAAGVDVTVTRYDGALHGMLCFTTVLPQSREMLEEAVTWLRACFAKKE
jgi:acetyl esterase